MEVSCVNFRDWQACLATEMSSWGGQGTGSACYRCLTQQVRLSTGAKFSRLDLVSRQVYSDLQRALGHKVKTDTINL